MMAEKSPKVQSKKISLCGGCTILGELPPEDPVCDSGIFCYGKQNLKSITIRIHSFNFKLTRSNFV